MKLRQTLSVGLVTLALSASMGASAGIKSTSNSVRVDLSDLDLTTASGEQTMQARLKRAARQVCGSTEVKTAGSLAIARENRTCYQEALAGALQQVDAMGMTAALQDLTVTRS